MGREWAVFSSSTSSPASELRCCHIGGGDSSRVDGGCRRSSSLCVWGNGTTTGGRYQVCWTIIRRYIRGSIRSLPSSRKHDLSLYFNESGPVRRGVEVDEEEVCDLEKKKTPQFFFNAALLVLFSFFWCAKGCPVLFVCASILLNKKKRGSGWIILMHGKPTKKGYTIR